jgi:hypothetical protein
LAADEFDHHLMVLTSYVGLFRPTVEDVIEFLVVERIAEARDGWDRTLNASRERFHRRQLHAAVRRYPDIAAEQLREQGYRVDDPETMTPRHESTPSNGLP